jgi:copper oxidase (laccase) domain-containing protein
MNAPSTMPQADWLVPAFTSARVRALMTTRAGGVSAAPFDSMNLRADGPLGRDDPQAVRRNRATLAAALRLAPVPLEQVHGAEVVTIVPNDLEEARTRASARAWALPARCRWPTACRCCWRTGPAGWSVLRMPAGAGSPLA